jgi:hypothetical protein
MFNIIIIITIMLQQGANFCAEPAATSEQP